MKMPRRNLFVVGTSYQFIATYCICQEMYHSSSYTNIVYFLKSKSSNYNITDNNYKINGEIIQIDPENWPVKIGELSKQAFFRFFFFQENSIFNKYLAIQLKKNGTIICLGPDGTKPYGVFNKTHEVLSRIKDTYTDLKLLRHKGFKIPGIIWSKYYRYGSFNQLDEVWLQYPHLFDRNKNQTIGTLIEMPALTKQHIQDIAQILGFKNLIKHTEHIILYFNQPFTSQVLIQLEIKLIQQIHTLFKDRKFIIKIHPATNPESLKHLKELSFLEIIEDAVPAEFYLAKVSNSLLISGWSAALMHDFTQTNNRYFYLYNLYKDTGDKLLSQLKFTGFNHVKMINSISEMELQTNDDCFENKPS